MAKQFGRLAWLPALSIALTAALNLILGAVAVSSASADDRPNPTAAPTGLPKPGDKGLIDPNDGLMPPTPGARPSGRPDDGDADHHLEIHDKYGNDVDKVFLPPLVVKGSTLPTKTSQSSSTQVGTTTAPSGLKNATQVDPAANLPINPNVNQVSDKSPADNFFQAATIGLGLMGVGAVGLFSALLIQRRRQAAENQ